MNTKAIWAIVVLIIIVGGGAYFYKTQTPAHMQDLGMYPYTCDNGSTFNLSPLEGLKTVQVSADTQGMFTGTATLALMSGTSYKGTAPDGQQVMLVGNGETIHLTVGSTQATCNPKPSQDSAPWNWGDTNAAANPQASITWKFTSAGETDNIPYTSVAVTVDGKSYDMGKFQGSCSEVGASGGIDGKGLLAGELSAAQCWFAGGGDEIGVFANEDGGYDIMVGGLSEGEEGGAMFRGDFKLKTHI